MRVVKEGLPTVPQGFAFDPSGERLAVSRYTAVSLFDTRDWSELATWPLPGRAEALTWDPRGERLATVGSGARLHVLTAIDGSLLLDVGLDATSLSVDWSPNGAQLAAACGDFAVRLLDAETASVLSVLSGHQRMPDVVAWSPAGDRLATGSEDGSVRVWDPSRDPAIRSLQHAVESSRRVSDSAEPLRGQLAWDAAGGRLAVRLGDTTRVWDREGRVVGDWKWMSQWSVDGTRLFGIRSVEIRARMVDGGATEILSEREAPHALRVHPVGGQLFYIEHSQVWSLDPRTGKRAPFGPEFSGPNDMDWSADGSVLALSGSEGFAALERETGRVLAQQSWFGCVAIACARDGGRIALATKDHAAHVVDLRGFEPPLALEGHTQQVRDLAWHPDGTRLATASLDGSVKLWDPASASLCANLRLGAPVLGVSWSPTGDRLAAVALGGLVRIWSTDDELQDAPAIDPLTGVDDYDPFPLAESDAGNTTILIQR